MRSLHKNIQLMLELLEAPFPIPLDPTPILTMLSVILLSMMILFSSKCDQASDLWQPLDLASELESDLQDTMDWGKKWLVDLHAGKTCLVSFDQ